MDHDTCSCGESTPHRIARRTLADGTALELWSDGSLCRPLGFVVKGSARPRTARARREALAAGWLVLGECCLVDSGELAELIAAARWAAKRDGLPGTVRRRLADQRRKSRRPAPAWTVTEADRSGKPRERQWILPRLGPWAGHAVLDVANPGARGRFVLCALDGRTARPLIDFRRLSDLLDHLADFPPTRTVVDPPP